MTPDKDYYQILGVKRDASDADIKKAFRKKAREHHPDAGGDEERFKQVNEAYEILSDAEKREQYDRFGRYVGDVPPGYRPGQSTGGWAGASAGGPGGFTVDFSDVFSDIFSGGGGGFGGYSGARTAPRQRPVKGDDVHVALEVTFAEAFSGVEKTVAVRNPDTGARETFTMNVPAGVREGGKLRKRGKGTPGTAGGPAGDLIVTIHIKPHEYYSREGADVVLELPVTIVEAAMGAEVRIPAPDGSKVKLRIPSGTQDGTVLKIPGKGAPKLKGEGSGDLRVKVRVRVPEHLDEVQRDLLERFAATVTDNPRSHIV